MTTGGTGFSILNDFSSIAIILGGSTAGSSMTEIVFDVSIVYMNDEDE